MLTASDMSELSSLPEPLHLAIGVFDGIHRGHQALLARALQSAQEGGSAVAVSFDPHPIEVLRPGSAPRTLTAQRHKQHLLEDFGMDGFLVLPFTAAFACLEAPAFIERLLGQARVAEMIVGRDWCFGRARSGNVEVLAKLGQERGFAVAVIEPVLHGGERVSSTRVREAVLRGSLEEAAAMLGRPYSVSGQVIRGKQVGRTIGYPTANLGLRNTQLPPTGVYAVRAKAWGQWWPGMANLGHRPTVEPSNEGGERLLETHLFDFEGDLYGTDMEIAFLDFLRGEQKFAGVAALREQIRLDEKKARAVLATSFTR
ncbi:MAG: bifunctional riboflavin kinase/FAD synthetase [Verrucomicrobiota bacterium]